MPVVALVGYTNAGKSCLMNALTDARLESRDALFATLDTTMRRLSLPSGLEACLFILFPFFPMSAALRVHSVCSC